MSDPTSIRPLVLQHLFARETTLTLQEVSATHFVGRLISFTRNAVNKIVILPYFGVSTPLSLFYVELYPGHTSDTKKWYQQKLL